MPVKSMVEISKIFVAFSEYMNFKRWGGGGIKVELILTIVKFSTTKYKELSKLIRPMLTWIEYQVEWFRMWQSPFYLKEDVIIWEWPHLLGNNVCALLMLRAKQGRCEAPGLRS